jgi:hypothetical protein
MVGCAQRLTGPLPRLRWPQVDSDQLRASAAGRHTLGYVSLPGWLRRAIAATGLTALSVGIAAAGPVLIGRHKEHDELPHTPEAEGTLPRRGPETEVGDRHVLVLDDPRYGVLNGRNYIGYCQDCPVAGSGTGMQCGGPCPAEGQTAAFRTPPPD